MDTYRMKSVVMEAVQVTADNHEEIAEWCGAGFVKELDYVNKLEVYAVVVPTPVGNLRAYKGDWVLKDPQGRFSKCSASAFAQAYEGVKTASDEVLEANKREFERHAGLSPREAHRR